MTPSANFGKVLPIKLGGIRKRKNATGWLGAMPPSATTRKAPGPRYAGQSLYGTGYMMEPFGSGGAVGAEAL